MIPATSRSLLRRLRTGPDQEAWDRLHKLYSPWIKRWAKKAGLQNDDVEDQVQEVMMKLIRAIGEFDYEPEKGLFRSWLRTIFVNRMRVFWRAKRPSPVGGGGDDSAVGNLLDQLEDPTSEQSRIWDKEHQKFIARRLMETVEPQVKPNTWQAFKRVVVDGKDPQTVATELGMTRASVDTAKCRVSQRLREARQELEGIMES